MPRPGRFREQRKAEQANQAVTPGSEAMGAHVVSGEVTPYTPRLEKRSSQLI
jgi:hypothetical protein